MAPFIDCLNLGSASADSCPASLVEYRKAIDRIDTTSTALAHRREHLVSNLREASRRMIDSQQKSTGTYLALPSVALPSDLPEPEADGAADHLPRKRLPSAPLPSTDGQSIDLGAPGPGRTLIYIFPMTGSPERDMPEGGRHPRCPRLHDCDFRDHYVRSRRHDAVPTSDIGHPS